MTDLSVLGSAYLTPSLGDYSVSAGTSTSNTTSSGASLGSGSPGVLHTITDFISSLAGDYVQSQAIQKGVTLNTTTGTAITPGISPVAYLGAGILILILAKKLLVKKH